MFVLSIHIIDLHDGAVLYLSQGLSEEEHPDVPVAAGLAQRRQQGERRFVSVHHGQEVIKCYKKGVEVVNAVYMCV